MNDELAAIRATVRGRVQGVGFRDYVYTRARYLRLQGYVRNGDDGRSVEVFAEGPRDVIEQILEYLHEGSRMSRIDAVDVEWLTPSGEYCDFGVAW
jgi:acylphosphatase